MKSNIIPLETERFYHLYNRGINGEEIFKQEKNHVYFLEKYAKYIAPIAETYAYCLLNNHFHLLVKIKTEDEIRKASSTKNQQDIYKIISNQFSHFFNGYAQGINKTYNRTGGLFETPFRRKLIDNEAYFTQLIFYIHTNPQKHGFVNDFRDYPHSSYRIFESRKPTKLMRDEGLKWFGGIDSFQNYHKQWHLMHLENEAYTIEFD